MILAGVPLEEPYTEAPRAEQQLPAQRGAQFRLLHLLTPVGSIAVWGLLGGLAGTEGHHAGLLGLELEWGQASALEEVGAITEGLLLAAAAHAPPVGLPGH